MDSYSVRDFEAGFSPWNLNNLGDVVGRQFSASASNVWAVHFADNTVLTLPPDISIVHDISDNGLVLGRRHNGEVVLFDTMTSMIEVISIPGFPYFADVAMDDFGNLVGTASLHNATGEFRGFVLDRATHSLSWVFPANMPLPAGATPFLELHDRNNLGHAVGVQGWVRGLEQLEVPIFYNGYIVKPIGNYTFMANGIKITNNDRIRIWTMPENGPESEAIYSGNTNTLTPFLDGRIVDFNITGKILWESPWPATNTYLTSTEGTQLLELAFPAGSGWSKTSAIRMNDANVIIGLGLLAGDSHGYMLTPEYEITTERIDEIIALILWGIVNDAGGVEIIGGHLRPVPPRGPLRELLDALPDKLRSELAAAIDHARLDNPAGARMFSSQARRIIESYRRQNRFARAAAS